jgi:hypothetical protein
MWWCARIAGATDGARTGAGSTTATTTIAIAMTTEGAK